MSKSKKITFIVNHAAYLVSHRLQIVEKLIRDGWNCQILIGEAGSEIMEKDAYRILNEKKIPFTKNHFDTSGYGIKNLIGFFQIFLNLFRFKPDIVHLVSPKAIIIGGVACRFLKLNLTVIAITGVGTIFLSKAGIAKKIIKSIYFIVLKFIFKNKKKKIIFQNNHDIFEFKKIFNIRNEDIKIIPGSGVEINDQLIKNRDLSKKSIVLPARLLVEKGINEFVEAAKILKKKYTDWNFFLAGVADYNNPSSIKIKKLKEWQNMGIIKWLGYISDTKKLYSECSIVCLPSYREGFPKCLIEAASFGIPIVTTNVPGCRDAIIPNETGLLVEPKDAKSLVDGLDKLIRDKNLRIIFGNNGYNLAKEKFDIKNVIDKTFEIYNY